ncbi:hypothetical protein I309_01936 [Cryptococcus deuterogattii LA55]|nr:hypothetical protein I309_01936 [Cryptococcus deuterogattii LA55]KIR33977.1 hypothetical protein I352_03206 [Cryptococcus deuterogattii MMRL2647]KIR91463.1 hypothetical protein I304_04938 [Cryptococcus deuterogattii CBS 10090]
MATYVSDSGPLDDYFRDELEGQKRLSESLGGELEAGTEGQTHLSHEDTVESQAAPAKHRQQLSALPLPGIYEQSQAPEDSFAEQFKYRICSSGLLEKDYVPGLSGVSDAGAELIKVDWRGLMRKWMEIGKERWDLLAAGACLLVGLVMGLGVIKSAGLILVLSLFACSYVWYQGTLVSSSSLPIDSTETPKVQTLSSLTTFLAQSDSLNATMMSSLEILQLDSEPGDNSHELRLALHRLTDNMADHIATATSTLLEMTDRNELAVLGEMYDIPIVGSLFYSRRRADDSSDSEQAGHRVPSPRRTPVRPLSTPSKIPQPGSLRRYGHSGRSQHMSIMSMPDPNDRFTQIPERTPRLLKRVSQERIATRKSWNSESVRHEKRIMETDENEDNKFVSAHLGEGDKSLVQALRSNLSPEPNTSPELSMSTPTTPITPITNRRPISTSFKHIPSPLSRRMSQFSETGLIPLRTAPLAYRSRTNSSSLLPSPFENDFPSSPIRPTESSTRALGSTDGDPGRKRRSLQNMPYYPYSETDHLPGADLARTRSMPISDLQTLRSAQSTCSRSRRSSVNRNLPPVGLGLGLPNIFLSEKRSSFASVSSPLSRGPLERINSVSPLTTPALTASSLGIHLKRRRMACCLLGLRFEEPNDMYWEEVSSTLEELSKKMKKECVVVENVLKQVRKDMAIKETLDDLAGGLSGLPNMGIFPPETTFPFPTTLTNQQRDFAPKTSDERLLMGHIDKMSSSIVKAWGELASLRSTLGRDGEGERLKKWAKVRESLGEVIREWERGREVSNRMDERDQGGRRGNDEIEESEEMQEPKMPDFLRAWEDTSTSESTSLETDRQSFINKVHLAEHPSSSLNHDDPPLPLDQLPRPGKDTVFESVSAPLSRTTAVLNCMTREERIKLMKEARGKGVNFENLLGADEMRKGEDARKRGGELVSELEGVIDVIRKMKEPEYEGKYKETVKIEAQTEQPSLISPSLISSPPAPMPPSLTSSSGPQLSNTHLQLDLGELKRSFRFPTTGAGGDDHVLG